MGSNKVSRGIYRHFKGGLYQVLEIAKHTESDEELVIYQDIMDKSKIWARPIGMFCSEIDTLKYPDATQKYRFERL